MKKLLLGCAVITLIACAKGGVDVSKSENAEVTQSDIEIVTIEDTAIDNVVYDEIVADSPSRSGGGITSINDLLATIEGDAKTAPNRERIADFEARRSDQDLLLQKREYMAQLQGRENQDLVLKSQELITQNNVSGSIPNFAIQGAEEYASAELKKFIDVTADPVSTFSVDVDTASYSTIRDFVERGQHPPRGSVRIEEMVNYFDYNYDLPSNLDQPFRPNVSIIPTPWNADTQLMHIGIKGYEEPSAERPPLNLVFLIDVSGSMNNPNKLPLVKKSLGLLVDQMRPEDRISIVTYASGEEVILKAARGSDKKKILEKIDELSAGGSTAGEAGLQKAYELAERYYKRKGVNRVIMATDGDFNVGISDPEELKEYVSKKRETGVYLSIFGYGRGNLKDNRIQALAQNGNGTAGYIDSMREARKVFNDDFSGNLFPIANDVKIQVEFNPAKVGSYRLIGYETRALARQDFNNDKVDAGDIGAGHTVTAIYEISPTASGQGSVDPLRYGAEGSDTRSADFAGEYGFVKLRYKKPGEDVSRLITRPVTQGDVYNRFAAAPESARFATAVASYGMKLRGDDAVKDLNWSKVTDMARGAKGADPYGYRAEFVSLTRDAQVIKLAAN